MTDQRVRESTLEGFLIKRVRMVGGVTFKLAPTTKGLPDRLVVFPGKDIYLVEMKAPGGRLSPMQTIQHTRLRSLGVEVVILDSRAAVVKWIRALPRYRNVE